MAFNVVDQTNPLATKLVEIVTDPSTSSGRLAVSEDNVTGGGPGFIYMVEIDNHLNVEDTYVKFLFNTAAGTLSAAECSIQLVAPAREVINYAFPGGVYYTTGLSVWIVGGGSLTDLTMPVSRVALKIMAT